MAGYSLGKMGIHQAMAACHVRRIAGNHRKRSSAEYGSSFPDISRTDLNVLLQPVVYHTAPGHLGALLLDLQPGKMLPRSFCFQKDGNDPGACAHIQHPLPRFHPGKSGQQHRVDTIAEVFRVLNNKISILQIIQTFIFLQGNLSIHVGTAPFSPAFLFPFSRPGGISAHPPDIPEAPSHR